MDQFDLQLEIEPEPDEPAEHRVDLATLAQAVVYATDWTSETIVSQLAQENIFLQPSFQRRDAWRLDRKSRFIESLLLGLPVPQIVLAERRDSAGQFIVLDGKQRLVTLLQFYGAAKASDKNNFALQDLELLTNLNGVTFADLRNDVALRAYCVRLQNFPIRSSIIRNWPDNGFLELVFVRLNEGSVKLSPQELRQAIAPGPFSTFLEEASAASVGLRRLLKLDGPDFRMRDAELLLRLIAFALFYTEYSGNMRAFLDNTTKRLNDEWHSARGRVLQATGDIEQAFDFGFAEFGEAEFGRKFKNGKFAIHPNKAVLECQIFYLLDGAARDFFRQRQGLFKRTFCDLSGTNYEFLVAVESTTKSLAATGSRFRLLGEVLNDASGGLVKPLRLLGNRLSL